MTEIEGHRDARYAIRTKPFFGDPKRRLESDLPLGELAHQLGNVVANEGVAEIDLQVAQAQIQELLVLEARPARSSCTFSGRPTRHSAPMLSRNREKTESTKEGAISPTREARCFWSATCLTTRGRVLPTGGLSNGCASCANACANRRPVVLRWASPPGYGSCFRV